MEQEEPKFRSVLEDRKRVADAFGIEEADIVEDLPIEAVDTGLGHIVVPVRSRAVLNKMERRIEKLESLVREYGMMEAQAFCFETISDSNTLHTRNFCPREGIEDPACGVGSGALGAYLIKNYYTDRADIVVRVEQGHIVQMESVITVTAVKRSGRIGVTLGGDGAIMARGEFSV